MGSSLWVVDQEQNSEWFTDVSAWYTGNIHKWTAIVLQPHSRTVLKTIIKENTRSGWILHQYTSCLFCLQEIDKMIQRLFYELLDLWIEVSDLTKWLRIWRDTIRILVSRSLEKRYEGSQLKINIECENFYVLCKLLPTRDTAREIF